MNAMLLARLQAARTRIVLGIALVAAGATLACAALAWRWLGTPSAMIVSAIVVSVFAAGAGWRLRRYDRAWLVARIDAQRRDLDDSTALLFRDHATLSPLQRLQRERIEQRLQQRPAPDLRPAWPWRALALAWLAAIGVLVTVLAWPGGDGAPASVDTPRRSAVAPVTPALVAQSLAIRPPAYTGLPASRSSELDAKAPIGSRLQWTLRFSPQTDAVELQLHDGRTLAMRRDGDDWAADLALEASLLYRVAAAGDPEPAALHRIDAIPDQPPRVRVRLPERSLTLAAPPPRTWMLSFEAEDDHGVALDARVLVTRTEGTGENIRFHEHVVPVRGQGAPRARWFDVSLRPADYGLQRGEDLIARIEVRDNRMPSPQHARSPSAILRWPLDPVLGADGLEGLARQVLPAYFRSQRQIIIDAEALLQERPRLAADTFLARSDGIGVDQRLLRLRYGQFLGEESEGGTRPLPTSDLPTGDLPPPDHAGGTTAHAHDAGHGGAAQAQAAHDDHAHDADTGDAMTFGRAEDVLEAYGHTHDLPEAATLLDPVTRETLRKALREMWQSELHLRQGDPRTALPYANRALEFIKQVQQADRIYLARVGSQLPPIDETRRLGGKRDGIAPRPLPPRPEAPADGLSDAWAGLDAMRPVSPAALDAVQRWTDANLARIDDPLSLIAAIDAVRRDPGCTPCLHALRGRLWAAMRRPDGGVPRRAAGDDAGRRYLRLLDEAAGAGP